MKTTSDFLPCDGCGLPASPEHIAGRVGRLELATRFRPIHINVLFVAMAPPVRSEDDFYGPSESKEFADSFLEGLEIVPRDTSAQESDARAVALGRLAEFQHRGYFLTYLSECPLPEATEAPAATIARLGPTLIRRIRFNYRPKFVAPLGQELLMLVDMLREAELGPNLILDRRQTLPTPSTGSRDWLEPFRRSVAAAASV